jgi:hypothetical protein
LCFSAFTVGLSNIRLKSKESDNAFTSAVRRSMSAMFLIQAFGREEDEFHRFGSTARKCLRLWFGTTGKKSVTR